MSTDIAPRTETQPTKVTSRPSRGRELAVFGGPKAVTAKYRERWRKIPLRDMARIVLRMYHDINTHNGRGYEILNFESRFASLANTRHALAMNSGTAALHSAYFAVGVRPGDEVIVPSYTFFATVAPILQCGGTPIFCDMDPSTLTVDPADVERRITARTRAIAVVHIWGNPARMDALTAIAKKHNLALIEDCSHAHGATYRDQPVGSWGDVGCFSLQGEKPVTGGEAGVAVTNDPALFDRMLALGHYGRATLDQQQATVPIGNGSLGLKYRPHLYSIILAQGSLSQLIELNTRRRENYALLEEELRDCPAFRPVPSYPDAERGGFLEYLLHYNPEAAGGWSRGAVVKAAQAEGVPIAVDRYRPLHQQPLFSHADLSHFGGAVGLVARPGHEATWQGLTVTEKVTSQLITLPAFTMVPQKFVRQCARALRKVAEIAGTVRDFRCPT